MRALTISPAVARYLDTSVDRYLNDVKNIGLITADEEISLACQIRNGDEAALLKLVKTNLRFVISVAKQYQNRGVEIGDLINEGNLGLIIAARKFDETKGVKFISYAVWWIRQSIIFAIAEQSRMIHLPYNYITLKSKCEKAIQKLEQRFKRKPLTAEIAEYLDVPIEKIHDLFTLDCKQLSIDNPMSKHAEISLLDILPNKDCQTDHKVLKDSRNAILHRSLVVLSHRDREVICLYFGFDIPFTV